MKRISTLSILSLVIFLGVAGLIYAKVDPAQTLFSQKFTKQNNVQMMTDVNTQQLITNLQQMQQRTPGDNTQNNNPSSATMGSPMITHRVSGNFNPGGTIMLEVIGNPTIAGFPFILVFSLYGDYPGLNLVPFGIPGILPVNPPYLANLFGILDQNGQAQFILHIPNNPSLLGLPLTSAVILIHPISSQISISNPVSYEIGRGLVGVSCCTQGVMGASGSQCIEEGVSVNYCRLTTGGAVQGCIPLETQQDPPPTARANLTHANLSSPAVDTIMQAVVASRISNLTYNATTFDCDDFADTLEQNLTGAGFNATYTYFIKYKGTSNVTDYAHAVTDVHLPDGSIFWIEPQTGEIISLDFDGDGQTGVNYAPNPYQNGYHPTDDNAKITVYDNAGAATAAGAPRD